MLLQAMIRNQLNINTFDVYNESRINLTTNIERTLHTLSNAFSRMRCNTFILKKISNRFNNEVIIITP